MGRVAQSLMCMAADTRLTADPWAASSMQTQTHTFVDIDHEIISMAIFYLPLILEGSYQLKAKVCAGNTDYLLNPASQEKMWLSN